jgi:hypothetical protein
MRTCGSSATIAHMPSLRFRIAECLPDIDGFEGVILPRPALRAPTASPSVIPRRRDRVRPGLGRVRRERQSSP